MNDFGRNDFTQTLRMLLEMPVVKPEDDPDAAEIGDFDPTAKSKLAGDKKSQQKTEKQIGTMLVDFEKKWNEVRENIRGAVLKCQKAVEAHQANTAGAKINNKATTDADARTRVMGDLDQKRADRLAQASPESEMEPGQHATDAGMLKQASFGDHLAGIDPKRKVTTAKDLKPGVTADMRASGGKGGASPATVRAGVSKKFPKPAKRKA